LALHVSACVIKVGPGKHFFRNLDQMTSALYDRPDAVPKEKVIGFSKGAPHESMGFGWRRLASNVDLDVQRLCAMRDCM
jgi:hypothetical protein